MPNSVQFLGLEARDDDETPETRFQWDRIQLDPAAPAWFDALAEQGRILIGRRRSPADDSINVCSADWVRTRVEPTDWIVFEDGDVRVMSDADYQAAQG